MWVFLTTETLFFGVLFVAYVLGRLHFPDAFPVASRHTNVVLSTANTAVLSTSSLTMALAARAASREARRATQWLLAATIAFMHLGRGAHMLWVVAAAGVIALVLLAGLSSTGFAMRGL